MTFIYLLFTGRNDKGAKWRTILSAAHLTEETTEVVDSGPIFEVR